MLDLGALVGVLVWLISFAGGPILHQLGHGADHVHLPSGAIVRVAASDADHDAPPSSAPDPEPAHRDGDAPASGGHGAGSLVHLGASAVLSSATAFVLAVRLVEHDVAAPPSPSAAPRPRWARPRVARGPPTRVG